MERKVPDWFTELLVIAVTRAGGNLSRLAAKTQIPRSTMTGWQLGTSPGAHHVDTLLRFVGGDFMRALPDHQDVVAVAPEATLPLIGRVAAGTATFHAGDSRTLPGSPALWRTSPRWHLIQPGSLAYIRVQGDSMSPNYPDGSILACGRSASSALPDLTPVIARIGDDEHTFKLLFPSGSEVALLPINPLHPVQRYPKSRVQVEYVVIGHICTNK